ncbi:hypothetical protein [Ammoniphilus resinae]|uniref:Family 2 glycosyl transferase n=1 Tax=Ammoniphilus resinae TaxID=861532 RepID=A0ABS4GLI9_9BACL|nr:hypothetical protein [Ammoniphilus resinae]MBP1930967.1 hypothetical protein [Ammoniphilus resinae]
MKRFWKSSLAKLGLTAFIAAGAVVYWLWPPTAEVESAEIGAGIQIKYRANGTQIEQFANQLWQPYFAKGVNMGATIPGHFPGELAITKEDYERWFAMIQEMGGNVIRIYTILQPEFYEALVRYNAKHQENPLFFIQGVWSPEEKLNTSQDAYDPKIKQSFQQEIVNAVDAVYGKAELEADPHSGKASGTYLFNAGPYLMGWIIGTEWDARMVKNTNDQHPDVPDYHGTHFHSKPEANPFEKWLAEMVDLTAKTETKYGWQHPIAFSNWVTTDPLEHPGEPLLEEDLVSVDPTHLEPVDWKAGYFASYHVYPYYPDFFTFDKSFQKMKNDQGEMDSYKTYLHQLKDYHKNIPVMISEFGVPASQGIAHKGMLGRHQGGHDEKSQGDIDAEMFRQIHQAGYSGAILFTWQDEWFKKTWNTMRYDIPDRRAYWYNALTNESFFGVLGMFPSKDKDLLIDGDASDWDKLANEEKKKLPIKMKGFKEIWASHDEGYLYLMAKLSKPFDPQNQEVYFGTDTLKGGNRHAPQLHGKTLDEGLETLVELSEPEKGRIKIASNYDFHSRLYGKAYGMFPVNPQDFQDNTGIFNTWRLVVNYKLEPPDSRFEHPFSDVEVGELLRGNSDSADPDYNSKAMWQAKGNILEIRIPWMLLGFGDPSSRKVISYQDTGKSSFEYKEVEGIRIIPWIVDKGTQQVISWEDSTKPYPVSQLPLYNWEKWQDVDVKYVERPKQSYDRMQQVMKEINQPAKK